MASTSEKGRHAEDIAVQALHTLGYEIVERNWRSDAGEIDIVARYGEKLVFVEVKARTGTAFGEPEEAITPEKQERLLAAAALYVAENCEGCPWRIDVIAMRFAASGRVERRTHYENAVQAGW
ncbi:MAG: YraN family protein [Anaerolineae bacterium]